MKIKHLLKGAAVVLVCALSVSFLILLVDKGTITGKMTVVTGSSSAKVPVGNVNSWSYVVLLFFILVFGAIIFLKKDKFFLRK